MIASCDIDVLISGESGTGKELAARAIHHLSPRGRQSFIPVNCGAIPDNLFENELFGHTKGAFTDARFPQIGLVANAEGGTLFLDEISVLSPSNQVKLFRLLQNKEYKPLGVPTQHHADIRIIAATDNDLRRLVREGTFREELYYRLNIAALYIPPLRERKEDIPILVEHFMEKFCLRHHKPIKQISKDAMKDFISYSWPGNVRELENKIHQIVVMHPDLIIKPGGLHSFLTESSSQEFTLDPLKSAKRKLISSFEKSYLIRLLSRHRGDVAAAAKTARKSRTGLWNLLKKYNISPGQFR